MHVYPATCCECDSSDLATFNCSMLQFWCSCANCRSFHWWTGISIGNLTICGYTTSYASSCSALCVQTLFYHCIDFFCNLCYSSTLPPWVSMSLGHPLLCWQFTGCPYFWKVLTTAYWGNIKVFNWWMVASLPPSYGVRFSVRDFFFFLNVIECADIMASVTSLKMYSPTRLMYINNSPTSHPLKLCSSWGNIALA